VKKENLAKKYFEIYSDIMNKYEKELLFHRGKVRQLRSKSKTKTFEEIENKDLLEEFIIMHKQAAKSYSIKIRKVKELFNPNGED